MLTVITHTRYDRPELLDRCVESVSKALPKNSEHLIIECKGEWATARLRDSLGKDLVAFVDDDDFIHPDSLNICLSALTNSEFGAACTFDCTVDINGNIISNSTGPRTYFSSSIHPRVIHHLCVMKSRYIDRKSIDLHNMFGAGIDWFIRQSVIRQSGCITVPMVGYYWTSHSNQHTAFTDSIYSRNIRDMSRLINETWPINNKSRIPVFDIGRL